MDSDGPILKTMGRRGPGFRQSQKAEREYAGVLGCKCISLDSDFYREIWKTIVITGIHL